MPDYKFTGSEPHLMTGLVQGRNATCSDGDWFTPPGSTVVCGPGSVLHTDEPYESAELALLDETPPEATPTPPDTPPTPPEPEPLPVVTEIEPKEPTA